MITVISNLLRDRSPLPIGSVAVAFEAVCPTRLDLLHQHYRRLCRTLIDMDEWGQVDLLNLLVRYARTMLPRPLVTEDANGQHEESDSDLKLLLTSSEPLFQSRNPAVSICPVLYMKHVLILVREQVVLAVARAFHYLSLPSDAKKIVSPLLRLLHLSPEIERVTLAYILIVTRSSPVCMQVAFSLLIVDLLSFCFQDVVFGSLEFVPCEDRRYSKSEERQDATSTYHFVIGQLSSVITGVYSKEIQTSTHFTFLTVIIVLRRRCRR